MHHKSWDEQERKKDEFRSAEPNPNDSATKETAFTLSALNKRCLSLSKGEGCLTLASLGLSDNSTEVDGPSSAAVAPNAASPSADWSLLPTTAPYKHITVHRSMQDEGWYSSKQQGCTKYADRHAHDKHKDYAGIVPYFHEHKKKKKKKKKKQTFRAQTHKHVQKYVWLYDERNSSKSATKSRPTHWWFGSRNAQLLERQVPHVLYPVLHLFWIRCRLPLQFTLKDARWRSDTKRLGSDINSFLSVGVSHSWFLLQHLTQTSSSPNSTVFFQHLVWLSQHSLSRLPHPLLPRQSRNEFSAWRVALLPITTDGSFPRHCTNLQQRTKHGHRHQGLALGVCSVFASEVNVLSRSLSSGICGRR